MAIWPSLVKITILGLANLTPVVELLTGGGAAGRVLAMVGLVMFRVL